jgi:hypothetical protein
VLSTCPEEFGAGVVVAFQESEQLAGDDALEAALGVAAALALGGAAGHVGAGVGIGAQTHQQDGVQARLSWRSPPRSGPVAGQLPGGGGDGVGAGQGGKAASERRRPACDQLTSTCAALSGPTPGTSSSQGPLLGPGWSARPATGRPRRPAAGCAGRWPAAPARWPGAPATWPAGSAGWRSRRSGGWWVAGVARRAAPPGAHDQGLGAGRWRPPEPGWRSGASSTAPAAPPAPPDGAGWPGGPGRAPGGRPGPRPARRPWRRCDWLAAWSATSTTRSPDCCNTAVRPAPKLPAASTAPAATASNLHAGEAEQPPVADGIGAHGGLGQHPAEVGDGGGGQGVAVAASIGRSCCRSLVCWVSSAATITC